MMKGIVIQKIIMYLVVLCIGVCTLYYMGMRERGYTDSNGNYVKGTAEIAQEHKEKYIAQIEELGIPFKQEDGTYLTFVQSGQINSTVKMKADFKKNGITVQDYMFSIYFNNSREYVKIKEIMMLIVPGLDPEKEFGLKTLLDKYNETGSTVTKSGSSAELTLSPIEGFPGVIVEVHAK